MLSQTTLNGNTRFFAWCPKVERVPQSHSRDTVHQMHSKAFVCGLHASTTHIYIHNIELYKLVAPYLGSSHPGTAPATRIGYRTTSGRERGGSPNTNGTLQAVLAHLQYRSSRSYKFEDMEGGNAKPVRTRSSERERIITLAEYLAERQTTGPAELAISILFPRRGHRNWQSGQVILQARFLFIFSLRRPGWLGPGQAST